MPDPDAAVAFPVEEADVAEPAEAAEPVEAVVLGILRLVPVPLLTPVAVKGSVLVGVPVAERPPNRIRLQVSITQILEDIT